MEFHDVKGYFSSIKNQLESGQLILWVTAQARNRTSQVSTTLYKNRSFAQLEFIKCLYCVMLNIPQGCNNEIK